MAAPPDLVALSQSLANVQSKVECIFRTQVVPEPSPKREGQDFTVVAVDALNPQLEQLLGEGASVVVTEKVDGTCTLLRRHEGAVAVWARYDRKPTKEAFQRKAKWERGGNAEPFRYRYPEDFRDPPPLWVLADDVALDPETGGPPGTTTHLVGWVPLPAAGRNAQYPWHHSAWDSAAGRGLFLVPRGDGVVAEWLPLEPFDGQTVELVGSKINQRYDFSSLGFPPEQHFLLRHGALVLPEVPLTLAGVRGWLAEHKAEGVVLHVTDRAGAKCVFKAHQHHTGLHDWGNTDPAATRLARLLRLGAAQAPAATPAAVAAEG